jgi:hypothetical protein
MKDLPHHMKKLNRKVLRSLRLEEAEGIAPEMPSIPPRTQTARELKKQAKQKMKAERLSHVSSDLTPDERNRKMKKRVPIFERKNHEKRCGTKPSQKKTPKR